MRMEEIEKSSRKRRISFKTISIELNIDLKYAVEGNHHLLKGIAKRGSFHSLNRSLDVNGTISENPLFRFCGD